MNISPRVTAEIAGTHHASRPLMVSKAPHQPPPSSRPTPDLIRGEPGSSTHRRLLVGASLREDSHQRARSFPIDSGTTGFRLSLRSAGMTAMEERAGRRVVVTTKPIVSLSVIAGLVPAIHVLAAFKEKSRGCSQQVRA